MLDDTQLKKITRIIQPNVSQFISRNDEYKAREIITTMNTLINQTFDELQGMASIEYNAGVSDFKYELSKLLGTVE